MNSILIVVSLSVCTYTILKIKEIIDPALTLALMTVMFLLDGAILYGFHLLGSNNKEISVGILFGTIIKVLLLLFDESNGKK